MDGAHGKQIHLFHFAAQEHKVFPAGEFRKFSALSQCPGTVESRRK